jgi:hypothetical protein
MALKCSNPNCLTKEISELKKCALCSEDAYCGKECQSAAWSFSGHKDTCFGKKYPTILLAMEVSLFGEDNGGTPL